MLKKQAYKCMDNYDNNDDDDNSNNNNNNNK